MKVVTQSFIFSHGSPIILSPFSFSNLPRLYSPIHTYMYFPSSIPYSLDKQTPQIAAPPAVELQESIFPHCPLIDPIYPSPFDCVAIAQIPPSIRPHIRPCPEEG